METQAPLVRPHVPERLRTAVWERDCGKEYFGTCFVCQCDVEVKDWHCAHVKPSSVGGLTAMCNLTVTCSKCNLSCGNQHLYLYIRDHYPERFTALVNERRLYRRFLTHGERIRALNAPPVVQAQIPDGGAALHIDGRRDYDMRIWMLHYKDVLEYAKENGRPPAEGTSLGNWCSTQRKRPPAGRTGIPMTQFEREMLEKIPGWLLIGQH